MARDPLRDRIHQLSLVSFLDYDMFKHRMLVRGYRVLGGITGLDRVFRETRFNEILIAQDETAADDLVTLQAFASNHDVAIHRYLARVNTLQQNGNGQAVDGSRRGWPETSTPTALSGGSQKTTTLHDSFSSTLWLWRFGIGPAEDLRRASKLRRLIRIDRLRRK